MADVDALEEIVLRSGNTGTDNFSSTCNAIVKSVVARAVYYRPPQTLSRNKILLLQVGKNLLKKSRRQFNLQQRNFVA